MHLRRLHTWVALSILSIGGVSGCTSRRQNDHSVVSHGASPTTATLSQRENPREAASPLLKASHVEPGPQDSAPQAANEPKRDEPLPTPPDAPAPQAIDQRRTYPIDLPTALSLAVGQNPQIAFTRERIAVAAAAWDRARIGWLPNLVIDPLWTRHDGQIQDTRGDVIDVSRSALFAGGGARLQVSTSEAYFAPLAARQVSAARVAESLATTNSTLRDVSHAYWDLVQARGRQAVLRDVEQLTSRLDELAQSYLRVQKLKPADADRVRAQWLRQRQELQLAERNVRVAAARLARWIRLDPFVKLTPADEQVVPVDYLVDTFNDADLAATALANRPELVEHRALVGAAVARLRQARVGPFLPSVVLNVSAGGFGGGPNGFFGDFDGRSDVGAGAIWQFENLGLGDRALARQRAAEVRQAEQQVIAKMDQVVAEAAEAAANVDSRRQQLGLAREAVVAATDSHTRNLKLFTDSGVELILPLEVLQSVAALSQARQDYLEAVIEYNKAQVQLHWALGSPIGNAPAGPSAGPSDE